MSFLELPKLFSFWFFFSYVYVHFVPSNVRKQLDNKNFQGLPILVVRITVKSNYTPQTRHGNAQFGHYICKELRHYSLNQNWILLNWILN